METAKPDWKDNLRFFITNKLYINLMNADYIIHEVDMLMIPIKAEVMELKSENKKLKELLQRSLEHAESCLLSNPYNNDLRKLRNEIQMLINPSDRS